MTSDYCVFIGDAALDEHYRADEWPQHGTKIEVEAVGAFPGGMIANAAVVYAGYGEQARFCWVMNDSPTTDSLLAGLSESGVDTQLVSRDEALADSRCIIVSAGDEHTVLTPRTGLERIELSDEALATITEASYIYTAIGDLRMLRHRDRLPGEIIGEVHAAGAKLVLDLDVGDLRVGDDALLGLADILFVNRVGMQHLAHGGSEAQAVAELLSGRLQTLVVTLAEDGCRLYDADVVREIPGIQVDVVDVTGAGDTFGAAFLYALNRTGDAELAAIFATAASARAVTVAGARAGATTSATVMDFIHDHRQFADDRHTVLDSALSTHNQSAP
ncbi:MAG: carbohydrate kinase family protein [Actinomycetota bacterium]